MDRLQPPHITPPPLRWRFFWGATLGGLGALDLWRASKRDGSTLSEVTRTLYGTHRPSGRAAFLASLTAGSVVLAGHILRKIDE